MAGRPIRVLCLRTLTLVPMLTQNTVISHIVDSCDKTKEEYIAKLKELDFTDEMINGTIGSLSGGWQMKMRLVRAVLIDPDIYLLDEPTNHLSESAAKVSSCV